MILGTISQNRKTLDTALISDNIREILLSEDYDKEYYSILAIISTLFDHYLETDRISVYISINNVDNIVIRAITFNCINKTHDHIDKFTKIGFEYVPLQFT